MIKFSIIKWQMKIKQIPSAHTQLYLEAGMIEDGSARATIELFCLVLITKFLLFSRDAHPPLTSTNEQIKNSREADNQLPRENLNMS